MGFSLLWILLSGGSWPTILAIGWIGHTCKLECPKWIKDAFWKGCSAYLVQDHERCLWNDKCKDANKKAGTSARPAGWLAGWPAGWLAVVDRLSSGFRSKAGCWCGSHPSDLEARPVVGVSKGAPGARMSTGYPLDLEARPVAPVVNSIATGAGFRSEAGCWCGSYPLDLEARPVVGVKF